MLASRSSRTPCSSNGRRSSARTFSATRSASSSSVDRRQQQAELVAAEAGHRVALAQRQTQAAADLLQQQVAVLVAERVVDLFEPVEIEQHESDAQIGALRRQDRPGRAFVEEAAIRKAGQHVVQREVLVLGGLAAQLGRGARDDPEEREVQQCQAADEQHVEAQRVVRDRGADRLVRQVELERTGRRARLGEAERRVDLEQLAEAPVVCVLGLAQIGDLGRGAACERRLELVRLREPLPDDRVVARVHGAAGVVPHLDTRHTLSGDRPRAALGRAPRSAPGVRPPLSAAADSFGWISDWSISCADCRPSASERCRISPESVRASTTPSRTTATSPARANRIRRPVRRRSRRLVGRIRIEVGLSGAVSAMSDGS